MGKFFCSRFHFLVFFSSFRFAHRAFAAFAARALALGVPAIVFAAFAAAFAFAWGFSASALPPLDPIRLRYCLMDSSTDGNVLRGRQQAKATFAEDTPENRGIGRASFAWPYCYN